MSEQVKIPFVLKEADKIPETIQVNRELTVIDPAYTNVLTYGTNVGHISQFGKESYFKADRSSKTTDLFDTLMDLGVLKEKPVTFHSEEHGLYEATSYFLMYINKDHCSLKATSEDNISNCCNTKHKLTYELVFTDTECEPLKHYMVLDFTTKGSHAMSFYDVLENLEDTIGEFIEDKTHGFRFSEEHEGIVLPFYDEFGQPYDVEVNYADSLLRLLSSARIIECTTEIIEPEF